MTHANLLITLFLVLGMAGLGFWMLNLDANQSQNTTGEQDEGADRGSDDRKRLEDLENKVDGLELEVRSQRTVLTGVQGEVEEIRLAQASIADRVGIVEPGEGGEPVAAAPRDPDLRQAIESVLAAKAEEDRKERREMTARRTAGFLLYGLEATPEQREQVSKVISTYFDDREKIGAQYSGDNADDQARDNAIANLDQTRNDELARIVGAASFAKMEERLNRSRNWGRSGGRGRTPFGGRGGSGRGGSGRGR